MRMLEKKEDEADAEVTWEDQQRINTFSKLNSRAGDLQDELDQKKQEKEALDDLASELELGDEDEKVLYKIGDAFAHIPLAEAQNRLQQDQEDMDKVISGLQEQIDGCETTMKELKVILYGKFGKAINLDV